MWREGGESLTVGCQSGMTEVGSDHQEARRREPSLTKREERERVCAMPSKLTSTLSVRASIILYTVEPLLKDTPETMILLY